jgi:hypothetical protein
MVAVIMSETAVYHEDSSFLWDSWERSISLELVGVIPASKAWSEAPVCEKEKTSEVGTSSASPY